MTPTIASIRCGITTRWFITISGPAKTIATNTGISASCVPKSKKNTGPGATVTETTTTTATTTKIAIDTGLIGNRQAVACPHFLPWMACNGLLEGLTFGVNSGKSSGYDAVENSPVKPDRARLHSIRHAGDRRPAGRRPA